MGEAALLRDRWIAWVLRRHRAILVVALLLTAVAAVFASRLYVDSDLRRLLPRDHAVVRYLETIEDTFGSTGSVNVVAKGGNIEARRAFTDALADELDGHPQLKAVDYRLPSDFFAEHALYYFSETEMEELDEKIQGWLHAEAAEKSPDTFLEKGDPEALDKLEAFVNKKREKALERTGFEDRYEREGVDANVMLLRPTQPAARLEFAKEISEDVRRTAAETFARTGEPWSGSGMTYNVVGPYTNKADEHAIINRDVLRAGAFAIVGVILVLYGLFRSQRAVVVLLVPLSFGVTWSLAAAQLVLGHLTIMTSLISTVVMGAGIDAGIHFYVRARRAREDHDDREAIRRAFGGLIVPLLVASSTTVGAFSVMASSAMPPFREFGIIAAMGVALCLLSMVTVLPALACLVGIKRVNRPPARTKGVVSRIVLARPALLLGILAALSVLAFHGAREIGFEYNGRELQSDHTRDTSEADVQLISDVFGKDIHAGILVRPSLEAARATLTQARQRRDERVAAGTSVVAELFGAPDLLPDATLDLAQRREQIEELLEEENIERLRERAEGRGEVGEDGERLTREDANLLVKMLAAQPFTIDDLPPILLSKVRTDDGSFGIFAYPDFDAADMRKGVSFSQETQSYLDDDDEGMFVGETTVYAAMFLLLQSEAPMVLGLAAALITILVYWQLRSVRQALMTLLPLALALWWLVGLMGEVGLKFTLFNLPIVPAILGIGVDNGVYLADRIRRGRSESNGLARSLQETGGAIMAAMSTTAIGFAAFMVADSAGVRGIGMVAVLGIALAAFAATLALPALSGVAESVRKRRS